MTHAVPGPLAGLALLILLAGCSAPPSRLWARETPRGASKPRAPATSLERLAFVSTLRGSSVQVQFDCLDVAGDRRRRSHDVFPMRFEQPGVQERTSFQRLLDRDVSAFPRPQVVVLVYSIDSRGWHGCTITAAPGRLIARVRGALSAQGFAVEAEQDDGSVPAVQIDQYGGWAPGR